MRVSDVVFPVLISFNVRVSVIVKPGAPRLGLHGSPAGIVTVVGVVGLVRGPAVDVTS